MTDLVHFVTHPEVLIDPAVPVPDWPLSERGRERMRLALERPWVAGVTHVACSDERKARDGAELLAASLGLRPAVHQDLGENDRSATGYLPPDVFQDMADRFFARPDESVHGWETARHAQSRIVNAVDTLLAGLSARGDVAIVSHGGVGALLLCALRDVPISRAADQPGSGGGQRFAFERDSRRLVHGWRAIESDA